MEIEAILKEKDIKPTPNRILVYRELEKSERPVSLADLEISLSPMDKASIFRVLELFSQKDIIHLIEDGSRSLKYELCLSGHEHGIGDQHVHFHCEQCGETFCFEGVSVPQVDIPAGFRVNSVNYVLKGKCPNC